MNKRDFVQRTTLEAESAFPSGKALVVPSKSEEARPPANGAAVASIQFVSKSDQDGDSTDTPRQPEQRAVEIEDADSDRAPLVNANGLPMANQFEREKSLYEILQENKAAEQLKFEEEFASRNALHKLDSDEVTFLNGLLEKDRLKDEAVSRDVNEQLQEFRRLQARSKSATSASVGSAAISAKSDFKDQKGVHSGVNEKRTAFLKRKGIGGVVIKPRKNLDQYKKKKTDDSIPEKTVNTKPHQWD
ncbi:uncharacterized protein V1510DRAFT_415598 [Dipodascopsis tothii]|uniref:uncharacterized protein n=1 Tax=Dipodascopsis tothii TaxID=44089 RepID=UPI0034CF6B0C